MSSMSVLAENRKQARPILTVVCEEPEGAVERCVYQIALSLDNLKSFWHRAKMHRTLFGEEITEDFTKFVNNLVAEGPDGIVPTGLFWVVDDFVGIYYLTDIEPGVDALVHYSFFDGRHKGRVDLSKAMIKMAFEKYGFVRLSAHLPLYATPVAFKFVEEVGFKKEGRKRNAVRYKDKWFDTNLYGILREEAV